MYRLCFCRKIISSKLCLRNGIIRSVSSASETQCSIHSMIRNLFAPKYRNDGNVSLFLDKHIGSLETTDLAQLLFTAAKTRWKWNPLHFKIIVAHLSTQPDPLPPESIGSIFYGIHKMECKSTEIRYLLKHLAQRIDSVQIKFDFSVIARIIYGLQSMSANHSEVRDVLTSLLCKIDQSGHPNTTPAAVGMCLAGFKSMDCQHKVVKRVLRSLSGALIHTEGHMTSLSTRKALFGLQNMSSDYEEVRELLAVLTCLIAQSNVKFVVTDVGIAFFGLKNMTCNHPEVGKIMAELIIKFRKGVGIMQTASIGMMLSGLQNKNGSCVEVKQLLDALTGHLVANPSTAVDGAVIGTGLFALQGIYAISPESRRFFGTFALKVNEHIGKVYVRDIANALYGLRHVSTDYQETRLLVAALANKLELCEDALVKPDEISMALFGLNQMSSEHTEVRALVSTLIYSMSKSDQQPPAMFTAQQAAKCVSGLFRMNSSHMEVRLLVSLLTERLRVIDGRMNLKDVCRCMYGLMRLSSDHEEVLGLLRVINTHIIDAFATDGDARTVADQAAIDWQALEAMAGMNNLESSHAEVEALVHTFISPLERSKGLIVRSKNIVTALWGLRRMSSEHYFVRGLMICLADKLYNASGDFTENDIRKSMVSLNNKSSDHREVRELVEVLAFKVREAEGVRLSSTYVSDTISNLPGLSTEHVEVKNLVKSLYVKCVLPSLKSG